MKRAFRIFAAAIAATAAAASCQQENIEPEVQEQDGVKFIVKASLSEGTKATLADGESIKWETTDKATAWSISADGQFGYNEYSERDVTVSSISEEGEAIFQFNSLPQGGRTWIAVNSNSAYDGCSAAKVEFQYAAEVQQAKAGALNPGIVNLISNEIPVPVAEAGEPVSLDVEMNIAGTIMRYLVYSSTGKYAEEKVQSVELISVDNIIAGNKACMAYNFARDGKYVHSDSEVSDECYLYWNATSKSIKTTLTEALSLDGLTEAAIGTGIYMAVPPVKIGGYKYVVTTDVAKYTFDASSKALTFAENSLKNVMLNLENINVSRIDLASVKGDLQYVGDLNAAFQSLSYEGVTEKDGGYWYAQTRDTGADWVTREGESNTQFYTGVQFECIDKATGEAADWLTVSYRADGNTHWWITADPQPENGLQRSATVTAIFPDVDGYLVTEACKTKSVTITQQAYTTTKILSLGGGVGDQIISGAGVDKLSLGWCAIAVNGNYAESWTDNKNNEQALYGNVVIECREGAANGPIVDWLTVEYGKDDGGKFDSTHLLATASENNTGAERKALVCCTYNAPEGYEFEGGAKSAFKQFFVTQPVNSGVKTIEFWGGLAAQFTHNHTAQTAWGLSYWVVKVDGADATDWSGDSHNEQAIYGSAEFKCYDYTNGVRGAEVDWVTVGYKKENDKVIDTWWLADIQENTSGAVRKAEIVCTFPEMEGYAYKDGQNVKSTIIIQEPSESTGEGETGGDAVAEGYSFNVVKNNGNPSGAVWGMPVDGKNGADFRIENIKFNGQTVSLTEETAKEVLALAFKNVDERPEVGYDAYNLATTQIYMNIVSYNGSTLEAGVATTADSKGYITRLTWYNSDATEAGHWFVFVP